MCLIVKKLLIKAGWQDTPQALRNLAITICTISIASTLPVTPSLVTTSIYDSLLHSQVFNPLNKLLKISLHISLALQTTQYTCKA